MNQIVLPYEKTKTLIKEADVLLYRALPFPNISSVIAKYTGGIYSHVALAHWDGENLYNVEYKEFIGSRSIIMRNAVRDNPNRIDIYRVSPSVWCPSDDGLSWVETKFDNDIAKRITSTALELTGNSYGWGNILYICLGYCPIFRLLHKDKDNTNTVDKAYVCSTAGAYSYRMVYADLCPHINDKRVTPNDLARSSLLHYKFTIGE